MRWGTFFTESVRLENEKKKILNMSLFKKFVTKVHQMKRQTSVHALNSWTVKLVHKGKISIN